MARDRHHTSDLPETICTLPWVNLSLDVDGSSRPCCKFAHLEPESPYPLANLRDTDLDGVWNGEAMQRLRRDFLAGVQPRECSTCWDEEAAGILSYRQTFRDYRDLTGEVDHHDLTPARPQALDLKLTNACNLKCRICGPVASSLWLQEELSVGEPEPVSFVAQLARDRTYYLSNKLTHHPQNLATLRSWLPGLEYLELTGGEPMLSPENRELVELIATEGHPEQVGILFNTNVTVIDDRILRHLEHFREVKVCLSIDDLGQRLEYQRAPARWDEVQANLRRYQEAAGERWSLYAFCSVSTMNVWYLPEYVRWLIEQQAAGPMELVLNLVHSPRHFCIQVLPPALKAEVRRRLTSMVLDDPSVPAHLADQVRDVLSFMDSGPPHEPVPWQEGVDTLVERDAIRGDRFADAMPEWFDVIDRSGAWTPTPTA